MTWNKYTHNPFSVAAKAQELTESFINGNRKFVRDELDKMQKKRAIAVTAYITQYLEGDSYTQGSFMRLLSDRVD